MPGAPGPGIVNLNVVRIQGRLSIASYWWLVSSVGPPRREAPREIVRIQGVHFQEFLEIPIQKPEKYRPEEN